MNRTVAYQETANNFSDIRQQIKGVQVSTIKMFGAQPPVGSGDFVGQMGLSADVHGNSLLYVYNIGGWALVGTSGTANIPDEVVMEDRANNFTDVNQRIEDCPIAYVDSGTRLPENVAIKGPGHIYVYESNPVQVYMSTDGTDWVRIRTTGDDMDFVEITKANNFTNPNQTIQDHAIASVLKGSLTPDAAGVKPSREGELYIQVAEGTADRKARLWVASNFGGWKWEALTHLFELPNTVAMTSKINDFQATQQTIAGRQILSFVDGGDQTPEQSKIPADYDGQLYIAVHDRIHGGKDASVWIANGNTWLPMLPDMELGTIVRTNKSNIYSNPNQFLNGGADARWLAGNRIKFSGASPIADTRWKALHVGEVTIYENRSVFPNEYSAWMAVKVNPDPDTNIGEWAMIWSNKHADLDSIAKTDRSNTFAPLQYITDGSKKHLITVAREGGAGSPKGTIVPMSAGETYTQSYNNPGTGETRHIWMSALEADTESWVRLHTANDTDVARTNTPNNFETREQFLGKNGDTKRDRIMGARLTTGAVYNGVAPTMFGEVVVSEEWDPAFPSDETKKVVKAYLAVGTSRKSWIEIGSRLKSALEMIDDGTNN